MRQNQALRSGLPGLAAVLCLAGPALLGQAAPSPVGWYGGGALGSSKIEIPGRSLTMEGIQFTNVNASADQAGVKGYFGYWITDHFGFEMAFASLGNAEATFNYFLPPSESGTGTTKVALANTTLAFQFGQQYKDFLFFAKGGVQFWRLSYDTKFRLSTGEMQQRVLDTNGNSLYWGAGAEWIIKDRWSLRLEGEVLKMDITDAKVISLGLTYHFKPGP